MAQVGNHRNLVSIVGVVTSGNPLVLVVAFCEFGSLLSVLFGAAAESKPVPVDLKLKVAVDIAAGMDFLHECSYIHRDLAARNVLIATGFIGKIADFGLARSLEFDDYYKSSGGAFPVRWTVSAPCYDVITARVDG